jgi:MFS family permease
MTTPHSTNSFFRSLFPIISLVILTLGSGFLTSCIAIRLEEEGYSYNFLGLISTVYYLGVIIGSFRCERFIFNVGHVRAYATFASFLAVSVIFQGILFRPEGILAMRFINGFCLAGLYIVIESWLLANSTIRTRGKMLSLYMVSLYAAMSIGQLFLDILDPKSLISYCIVSILASLSVVPLSMSRVKDPVTEKPSLLDFKKLYKISPSGVLGCACGGLLQGAVYGLLPIYARDISYSPGYTMSLVILGATILQYPIGHLSDHLGRRAVLLGVACLGLFMSLLIIGFGNVSPSIFMPLIFIFGGCSFSLYPLSISHACDYLESHDIVAATQGLLLAYGVGACVGPFIASYLMIVPQGLFIYFAVICVGLAIFFSWRQTQRASIPVSQQQDFVPVTNTTPVAMELDPRSKPTETHSGNGPTKDHTKEHP